ncbi:hypothetical protein [Fluviicola taffensis]|uniref:Outer membrane protein beta-barrel domain-containing protein n=1 Tax=Fluviicola taffensis (strain DSM 16823 / NCIMB 13979 / RW262) TaxID=755732 RepID=F2IK73_FLUTR|nr:hypothetical protein [Fluviicola taffensis]AEA43976.1 hypothetical protein Fluta_1990 [Fluviicola taffensis DSM 16823]
MIKVNQILILVAFLFGSLNSYAQTKDSISKPKASFCSKNELGGLIGIGRIKDPNDYVVRNLEWALELTSINGIRYNPWFVGIGVGIRSWRGGGFGFPLFGHVSLDLWKTGLFIHGDIGYQFGIRKNYFGVHETGGFYAAYGLGYNFAIKRQSLYVKASICHQKANAEDKYGGLGPSTYQTYNDMDYLFCRISLGIQFSK